MNKIFILGLDGLEYELVEKWNLKNLKQNEYSKIIVPINKEKGVPDSPQVWSSFLTGKRVFKTFNRTSPLTAVYKIIGLVNKYLNLNLDLLKRIREKLPKKLWKKVNLGFPPLKMKSFIEMMNSKTINVPFYDHDSTVFNIMHYFSIGRISLNKAISLSKALYRKRKNQILHETEKFKDSFDLIFAFMHFPDMLQHYLEFRPKEIKDIYLDLNYYFNTLKNKIEDSRIFIIISDHGFDFKTGTHSKHGFYSSSKPLIPKPKNITDFFQIITMLFLQDKSL